MGGEEGGGGGRGRPKPSQPLKLPPPPKHDGRSSATYELPQKFFACWRFSHSRAGAAISRTLALLNSASTNFINYLPSYRLALPRSPCPGLKPPPKYDTLASPLQTGEALRVLHWHRIDKYLDTLLANQTARKAMPPTTDKSCNRKIADCPSY